MANYFSKYQGRGGPAIAPGIVQMMGSIGDEYAKGIKGLAEGVEKYRKNKAERNTAEANLENSLARMKNLYGEEAIIYAVDDKIMSKIESGKGTKEDFLSAFNSLNTMEESIEENREREEKIRQFDITSGIQQKQLEATERIAEGGWAHAKSEGDKDRGSREGMHTAGIASAEAMQTERIAQSEDQFKDKLDQDFFLEMDRQGLSREEIAQRYTIHRESSDQAWNLAQDKMAQQERLHDATLKETKRVNQVTLDKFKQEGDRAKAGQVALGTYTDKTQTEFDPDAHSAAMMGVGSLSGPTPDQLQSYMDNPEQFQRQLTPSERAVKALQTPGISPEVQDSIAKMANADAGTGGIKFVKHEPSGMWMSVGPTGTTKMLGSGGKATSEKRLEYDMGRNVLEDENKKTRLLAEYESKKIDALAKHVEDSMEGPGDPGYDKIEATYTRIINMVKGGKESDEDIPEYDLQGKLKN